MRAVVVSLALLAAACGATRVADLHVPAGFTVDTIASLRGARELVTLPDGDLLVGTSGRDVYIVSDAEGTAGTPRVFASFDDDHASGIAYAPALHEIFAATMHHVWSIPYDGERTAARVTQIADVRAGSVAPDTDGDVHVTTSVAYTGGLVYVAVGSSCNATMGGGGPCVEVDPTRAAVSVMKPDGSAFALRAKRIRNAIALAVNPATGSLWVGDAGQDDLPSGHPYEFLDDLSVRRGVADYGWPECEENHRSYVAGSNCASVAEPLVELPAYSTIIGAAFYPANQGGRYAFPNTYRGGLFVTAHGSWHINAAGCSAAPPRVAFVAMNGDRPAKSADWSNPTVQWSNFVTGFQHGCTERSGRPTGITVGTQGSLFIGDDASGSIYRVRPAHG